MEQDKCSVQIPTLDPTYSHMNICIHPFYQWNIWLCVKSSSFLFLFSHSIPHFLICEVCSSLLRTQQREVHMKDEFNEQETSVTTTGAWIVQLVYMHRKVQLKFVMFNGGFSSLSGFIVISGYWCLLLIFCSFYCLHQFWEIAANYS